LFFAFDFGYGLFNFIEKTSSARLTSELFGVAAGRQIAFEPPRTESGFGKVFAQEWIYCAKTS
jgi:hypothetical protein